MKWFIVLFLLITPFSPSVAAQEKPKEQAQPIPRRFTPESEMKRVITNSKEQNKEIPQENPDILSTEVPPVLTQALAIVTMALLPFLVILLSPFMKIVVVLSLLRTALGVQNSPPNAVINGIAIILSIFVMYPVATDMYDKAKPVIEQTASPDSIISKGTPEYIYAVVNASKEPFRQYLVKNSLITHQRMFYRMIYRQIPQSERQGLSPTDFIVLIPSFITGQLKAAFEIGVLIYIPFFVIDMVVSNILLAMGMMMLSPVTISMPLKLFLLVMLDGWSILIEGLVYTFKTGSS